jgi:gas vesicle protein
MADQEFSEKYSSSSASSGRDGAGGASRNVADQALAAGRELKEKVKEAVGTSTEAVKDQASDFVDAAKDAASDASDKLKETLDGQRDAGARYVSGVAEAMRRAAREFDSDLPIAGKYIRKAASQVETVSESVRNGDINDLVSSAQDFARRQPTAFLGIAVLAGFGVVRFLKSSAEGTGSMGAAGDRQGGDGNNNSREHRHGYSS